MFTGIIKIRGTVTALERGVGGARLVLLAPFASPVERGESVAVDGVCLTALPLDDHAFFADLSDETLQRTTLGDLVVGDWVNLERALMLGDRLGGHIVQGHVDCVGTLMASSPVGDFALYRWSYPEEFNGLVVPKGSIAVNGVSLTIVDPEQGSFGAALIPETLTRTGLGEARVGGRVNLEFDIMAKFARQLLAPYVPGSPR
jgi:riboflavin synthase